MPEFSEESTITSETLLRARERDGEAWERILEIYEARVFHQVLRSGISQSEAPELTKDVFTTAFEKLHKFRRTEPDQSLGKWLNALTFNTIVDFIRGRKRAPQNLGSAADRLCAAEPLSDNSSAGLQSLKQAAFASAVDELAETYAAEGNVIHWECFRMHKLNGQKTPDVAAELNVSVSYVTTNCGRVQQRLAGVTIAKLREMSDG